MIIRVAVTWAKMKTGPAAGMRYQSAYGNYYLYSWPDSATRYECQFADDSPDAAEFEADYKDSAIPLT